MSLERMVRDLLVERGVTYQEIASIVFKLQHPYNSMLSMEECLESVERVMQKREVLYALLTGITLDILAEKGELEEPLATIIREDEPLYGVDETLAMGIASIYGTIGFTSFGYLDKKKEGIIADLNDKKNGMVHTFLDDLVAGVASAASARLAHNEE